MKVIFLQDVPHVARAGEVKEVANGYARNFLMPKKLATLVSPAATKALEARLKIRAREQGREEAELIELANQLEGKEIILKARAGGKERLYGSITAADIAAELQNAAGSVVDKRKIELDKPIHQLGSYEVIIKLAKDIMPKIRVTVVKEEVEAEKETSKGKKVEAEKETGKDKEVGTEKKTRAKRKTKAEKETNQGESGKTAAT